MYIDRYGSDELHISATTPWSETELLAFANEQCPPRPHHMWHVSLVRNADSSGVQQRIRVRQVPVERPNPRMLINVKDGKVVALVSDIPMDIHIAVDGVITHRGSFVHGSKYVDACLHVLPHGGDGCPG